mmetsp:Transcript_2246/g.2715  ORF Transcript_2246/g.2715 Transcript_2246/m.2715 type:complete len:211 (-) Transcript_2246:52-684(-)
MMNNFLVFLSALLLVSFRTTAFSGQLNNNPNCKELLLNRREAATSVTTSLIFSSLVFGRPTCSTAAVDLSQFKNGPNGLKYLVSEAGNGSGRKPQRGTKVKTSYTLYVNGFGEDGGKKIDSSKGLFGEKPFEFDVGVQKVIKGWDISILDMEEGESRRLIIPSELGYGEKGVGSDIPGGATLYFDVKLVEIGKAPNFNEKQLKWLEEHPL